MSDTPIPYSLRQNKAIDRYAFIELLSRINIFCNIRDYSYIGLGGYSLEDFKYIHSHFGIRDMISLEEDEEVHKRQLFNCPLSCIKCCHQSTDDFINEFNRSNETIVWLDYVRPSNLRKQVEEFQAIVNKLSPLDIIKITLNANPSSYVARAEVEQKDLHEARIAKLKDMLGELYPPAGIVPTMMTMGKFPSAILLILKSAASAATSGQSISFQPLTAFSYADGQQMLTLTGIILEKDEIKDFLDKTKIINWELGNTDWAKPRQINVPELTMKERLYIDSLLPGSDVKRIQDELKFRFNRNENRSLKMLETYALFYRHSPYFSRILI